MPDDSRLVCRFCGQEHAHVALAPGEKALCVRCDGLLAQGTRLGADTPLVFSVTGLILAVPAVTLPFITAGKLGDERVSHLLTGVLSLWNDGMRLLAVLVVLCGGLLPVLLLATLAAVHAPIRFGWLHAVPRPLFNFAGVLEHWSIPEVQVLAVFVALMKLGSLVDIKIGLGFWCYCGMALSLVIAQHSFEFEGTELIRWRAAQGGPPS